MSWHVTFWCLIGIYATLALFLIWLLAGGHIDPF